MRAVGGPWSTEVEAHLGPTWSDLPAKGDQVQVRCPRGCCLCTRFTGTTYHKGGAKLAIVLAVPTALALDSRTDPCANCRGPDQGCHKHVRVQVRIGRMAQWKTYCGGSSALSPAHRVSKIPDGIQWKSIGDRCLPSDRAHLMALSCAG